MIEVCRGQAGSAQRGARVRGRFSHNTEVRESTFDPVSNRRNNPPLRKTRSPMGYSVARRRLSAEVGEMNVTTLHLVRPGARAPWRRTLIAVLAISAVLVGLLAMHSLAINSGNSQSENQSSSTVAVAAVSSDLSHANVEPEAPALLQTCTGGLCQVDCLMLGVLCTPGLLTAAVTWLLHRGNIPRVVSSPLTRVASIVAQRLSELKPPSLVVLSISRT